MDQFREQHLDHLKHMAVFSLVVESGSFTGAAKRLGMAKSAVSRYVSELEDELGVLLLRRTTRKLYLTEAGERFFAQASRVVDAAVDTIDAVEEDTSLSGTLHIAATDSFGEHVVLPAAVELMKAHPEIEVKLSLSDHFVDLVEAGIDLAIRQGTPGPGQAYISRRIGQLSFKVLASRRYLKNAPPLRTPQDAENHEWVLYHASPNPHEWKFSRGSRTWTVAVNGRLTTDSAATMVAAAKMHRGIIGLVDYMATKNVTRGLVEVLTDYQAEPIMPIYAVYPRRRFISPRVVKFLEILEARLNKSASKR